MYSRPTYFQPPPPTYYQTSARRCKTCDQSSYYPSFPVLHSYLVAVPEEPETELQAPRKCKKCSKKYKTTLIADEPEDEEYETEISNSLDTLDTLDTQNTIIEEETGNSSAISPSTCAGVNLSEIENKVSDIIESLEEASKILDKLTKNKKKVGCILKNGKEYKKNKGLNTSLIW